MFVGKESRSLLYLWPAQRPERRFIYSSAAVVETPMTRMIHTSRMQIMATSSAALKHRRRNYRAPRWPTGALRTTPL